MLDDEDNATGIFSVERVQFDWTGQLIDMTVSNNILLMLLNTGRIKRIDLSQPAIVEDVDIGSHNATRIFLDYSGRHAIVTTAKGDNYYLHAGWRRCKQIGKLKGVVSSVAWSRNPLAFRATKIKSGPVLVCLEGGVIFELELDAAEDFMRGSQVESYCRAVFTLSSTVTGIVVDKIQDSRDYMIVCTTNNRLYQFRGLATPNDGTSAVFEQLLSRYVNRDLVYQELPGDLDKAELRIVFDNAEELEDGDLIGRCQSFVWLTVPGIYHGKFGVADDKSVIQNAQLMPYPVSVQANNEVTVPAPVSIASTPWHFVLMYQDHVKAICKLNDEVVWTHKLDTPAVEIVVDSVKDTMWIYTGTTLHELVVTDEDRGVSEIYLRKRQFPLALKYAKSREQRQLVNLTQADYYYSQQRYLLAGKCYAESNLQLEEVSLKFMSVDSVSATDSPVDDTMRDALMIYLELKLKLMDSMDRVQCTLLVTWILDIKLQELDRLRATSSKELPAASIKLKEWLLNASILNALNRTTTYKVFANYNCQDEMLFYAIAIKDHAQVIQHHIREGNFSAVIDAMRAQSDLDTVYKWAPLLMQHAPVEAVTLFINSRQANPRHLLTALQQYNPQAHGHDGTVDRPHQAIRYLEYCVQVARSTDTAVHNHLLSLYVQLPEIDQNEMKLLQYLRNYYQYVDLQYALRLCTQHKQLHACVVIYGSLRMYEEAVELALKHNDLTLAHEYADACESDPARRRALTRICRYMIEEQHDIKAALQFMRDSNLLVRIEDLIAYLPDHCDIGEFKAEFCDALQDYKSQVDMLRDDMEAASVSCEAIKADMRKLKQRFIKVPSGAKCQLCAVPLQSRPFYMFPCEHGFHATCLVAELLAYHLSAGVQRKVLYLQQQIATGASMDANGNSPQQQLDDVVAADCCMCGEYAIKAMDKDYPEVAWLA